MRQLTRDEAIALHDSEAWKAWTPQQRAAFQMVQDRLCMPFSEFHKAVEETLGRSVWTHEFGLNRDGLMREITGQASPPSFEEIVAMLPAGNTLIVRVPGSGGKDHG